MSTKNENEEDILSTPPSAPLVPRSGSTHRAQQRPSPVVKTSRRPIEVSGDLPADMTDTAEIDRAVDDITSKEADAALVNEDTAREEVEKNMPKHRIRAFFSAWLGTKRGWKWTLAALFIIIVGLGAIPTTRYWILNTAGVRCSLSFNIVDGDTQLALPGATAAIGSTRGSTDHGGFVALYNLKLGPQTLVVQRSGFATIHKRLILGWGSNPLGSFTMKDTGLQYTVYVRDYVTGAPITGASANNSGSQTLADKTGKIMMTISGDESEQPIPITVSASGYATESINLSGKSNKPTTVLLPPSQKEVYVANQDGTYNLCTSYVDGTDRRVLLAGTSTETSDISLAASPDGTEAALVSTRDASYDSNDTLLQAITLVNISSGTVQTLDHAEQIKLIGWVGTTVIYEEETTGGSSPQYDIISYNYATSSRDQLATSSQFATVVLADGVVYYAIPASASATGDGFFATQPDGTEKQTILSQDVWTVLRSSYTEFSIDTANGWYVYTLGSNTALTLSSPPNGLNSMQYLDSPNGKLSVVAVNGQLQIYTVNGGKVQTAGTVTDATYPLRWLTNSELIYRVTDGSTSADYVLSITGSSSKLITNVTNATSITDN